MPLLRVFKRYFPPCTPRCFIRIHTRLRTMQSKCPRRFTTSHSSSVSQIIIICIECHSKQGNGCFTILFEGAYFLLAVMVEGCESSQLRMANQLAVLASYQHLLTALQKHEILVLVMTEFSKNILVTPKDFQQYFIFRRPLDIAKNSGRCSDNL